MWTLNVASPGRLSVIAAALLSGLLFLAGCGGSSADESMSIAGSTTVLPVVSRAAEVYRQGHPNAEITVNAGGSGTGINLLGRGQIEIGMSSRKMTPEERQEYPAVDFTVHAIGVDGVIPVVSSEIYSAGISEISREQVAQIYRGEITNWKELGGPNRKIYAVDKEQSRGTRHVFMEYVMGDPQPDAPGADVTLGANNEEQTAIAQSDSAIGLLSHAWLNEKVRGLALILENGEPVQPTLENIRTDRWPISRKLRLYTDGRPEGLSKSFISFVMSDRGQEIVRKAGYVRISE